MISSKALKGLTYAFLLVFVGGFTSIAQPTFFIVGAFIMFVGLVFGLLSLGF